MPSSDPSRQSPDRLDPFGIAPVHRELAAGDTLFRQGDPTIGVFRLLSGGLRLMRATVAGAEVAMHTVRPGELFAEASLFTSHYHCNAVATVASELHWYAKDGLQAQLQACPETLWRFTEELAHRLQGMRSRLEVQQVRNAKERVLQYLGLCCDADGQWRQQGTLKHFAQEIGLTHEALYRTLAVLEREGRITRSENGIRLATPNPKPTRPASRR